MRLWHVPSSVNTFFKRACTVTQSSSGARLLIFGRALRLLPYFMCGNSEGFGDPARLRECAGSPDPSLIAYVVSTIIS